MWKPAVETPQPAEAAEIRQMEAGVGIPGAAVEAGIREAAAGVENPARPELNRIAEAGTVQIEGVTTVVRTMVKVVRRTEGRPPVVETEETDCSAPGRSVSVWLPEHWYRVSVKKAAWEFWNHHTAAPAEDWKAAGCQNWEPKAHRTTAPALGAKTKAHPGFPAVRNWACQRREPLETGELPESQGFPERWGCRILERK